ncbi:MAG: M48 family metalloprotease [Rhizobiales bacterium]|nr:M48 family metalloprotease [Hyphomicrobiales bacterium]
MRQLTRRFECNGARRALALIVLVAAGMTLGACVRSLDDDTLMPLMSLREEEEVGRLQHPRMLAAFGGAYHDRALDQYVGELTVRLIERSGSPNAVRSVTVLDSPSVNAFALPGGYIYVTRGLLALASDEAELATVIAHEVGHVEARHPAKRIARLASAEMLDSIFGRIIGGGQAAQLDELGSQGYVAHYSRIQELEADALGIHAATKAGYDPRAALSFLEAMERDQSLQSRLLRKDRSRKGDGDYMTAHPPTPARLEAARKVVAGIGRGGERQRETYLSHLDGLTYGQAPGNGVVNGRRFLQPNLGFAFEMPPGYVIHNRPSAVVAIGEGKNLILFDGTGIAPSTSLSDFVESDWASALAIQSLDRMRLNGMEAVSAYAPLGHRDVRLVAIRFDEEQVYRFIALAPPGELAKFGGEVARLAHSFRKLSGSEARAVRPLSIKIHKVRAGDTIKSLARSMPFSTDRLERFRVLNNLDERARLVPGQMVKLISG